MTVDGSRTVAGSRITVSETTEALWSM